MSSRKNKTKKRIYTGIIIVLIAIIAIGYFRKEKPDQYESITAETGDIITYYSFAGNIETRNRQTIISEKIMQISEIKVKDGDVVKQGDVLIKTSTGDEIKAKIAGEVVGIRVEENEQVMAGMELMKIVDYDNLQVTVKIDEYDLSSVEAGEETNVRVDAIDKDIKGTISSISREGTAVNGVTFFTATIDLDKDESLRIGMTAEVTLLNESHKGVVTLPMSVIQFDENNQPYVLKKNEKGEIVRTDISTGINDGIKVEIKSGVKTGETVLYPMNNNDFGFGMRRR